jgi:hypothetical protein
VREEIGITISVGVSFCKILAKMGSELKKPDATTVLTGKTSGSASGTCGGGHAVCGAIHGDAAG